MSRKGPDVIVESSPDTPLVWFDIAIRGGASADPKGVEGLHRHAALLARRGAGRRDRAELDETLDSLGAALEVGVSRDAGVTAASTSCEAMPVISVGPPASCAISGLSPPACAAIG